jgi:hypothetical protein
MHHLSHMLTGGLADFTKSKQVLVIENVEYSGGREKSIVVLQTV